MIVNLTNDRCLVHELQPALTFFRRLRGLMWRAELPPGSGLLIAPCRSVHTMHMRFPIDVIFLDRGWRVIGLEQNLTPWRISHTYRQAQFALEVPVGTIASNGTVLGDQLGVRHVDSTGFLGPLSVSAKHGFGGQ